MQQTQSPLLRLWQLGKDHHGGLIAAIFCAVAGVLLGLLPYLSAGRILVALLTGQRDWNFYLLWCMVALGGYLAKTLLYNLALSLSHKATFQILRDIRKMVLSKMPRLPLGDILDTSSGRLKQIVVDQVESMETTLAHLLPEMTSNLLAPVCVLVYLFTLDWRMALLSLVSIPVGMAFMMAIMGSYGKDYQGAVETTQAMNETIVEYIGGIEVIKAFNQGKNSYEKFSSRVRANAAYYYNWMKKCQFGMALAYAIAPTTLITVLPVGWIFYTDGSLSAEVFLTTIILSMSIVGSLIAAMGFVDNLAKVGTIVGSVDEILLKPEQDHGTQPAQLGRPDIALDHVSFGYAQDKEILHNISLTIPAGSLTALVGPSGSGKSTIAKLIAGFWDVTEGRITLGGVDVKTVEPETLFKNYAIVFQDVMLFDETVMENIRLGRGDATDEEVMAAARAAQCEEFIQRLPQGYQTNIGENGSALSGGERQRISIARALLKNAPIVLLDEATASMDAESETLIQDALSVLLKDKTVMVIAHRMRTVANADKIVVLDDGKVSEMGTPAELMKKGGLYAHLVELQQGK